MSKRTRIMSLEREVKNLQSELTKVRDLLLMTPTEQVEHLELIRCCRATSRRLIEVMEETMLMGHKTDAAWAAQAWPEGDPVNVRFRVPPRFQGLTSGAPEVEEAP